MKGRIDIITKEQTVQCEPAFTSLEFKRMHQAGDEGFLMLRIAVAVNDLISGNSFCGIAERLKADPKTKDTGRGLAQFCVNSQIGHLSDPILLIHNPHDPEPTLDSTPRIKLYLKELTPRAQQSYRLSRRLLPGNKDHSNFRKYVENFRNRVSFHYDTGFRGHRNPREVPIARDAMKRLAAKTGKLGRMVLSDDINSCRLSFADDIMENAVCRSVWEIDSKKVGDDLQTEADRIAGWISKRARAFVVFGGELCQRYFAGKHI